MSASLAPECNEVKESVIYPPLKLPISNLKTDEITLLDATIPAS